MAAPPSPAQTPSLCPAAAATPALCALPSPPPLHLLLQAGATVREERNNLSVQAGKAMLVHFKFVYTKEGKLLADKAAKVDVAARVAKADRVAKVDVAAAPHGSDRGM